MKRVFPGLIILCLCFTQIPAAAEGPEPWTDYFGSAHVAPPWGHTMRGAGRGKLGLTEKFDPRIQSDLRQFAKNNDVLVGVSLPVDQKFVQAYSGSDLEKMRKWRENLARDAKTVIASSSVGKTVYWEIGNEINIRHFGRRLCAWMGECTEGRHNDPSIIPFLVENYLAPAVETLRSVSSDRRKNPIILGSMAAFFRADSMKFLEELLNYRIRGDQAESLRGKRVYEIIDIAAINYLLTWGDGSLQRARKDPYDQVLGDTPYHDGDIWLQELNNLYDRWLATGKLRGLWATEEIGKSKGNENLGAATALKVAARFLQWWAGHGMTSEQGRCIFWGAALGAPGTTGQEGMQTLYDILGDSVIKPLAETVTIDATGNYEAYVFQPLKDASRRVVILFPRSSQDQLAIKGLTAKALDWKATKGTVRSTLHLFSSGGHEIITVPVRHEQDRLRINFPKTYSLDNQAVALILLQQEPLIK